MDPGSSARRGLDASTRGAQGPQSSAITSTSSGRGGQGLRLLRPRQGGGRQGIQEQQTRHLRKSFMEVKKVHRHARYQSNSAISNIVAEAPALNSLYYHTERH